MVRLMGRVFNRGQNVVGFEIWIIGQNLLMRSSCAQELQDVSDTHSHATNARTTPTLARLDGDALEQFNIHARILSPAMPANKPYLTRRSKAQRPRLRRKLRRGETFDRGTGELN